MFSYPFIDTIQQSVSDATIGPPDEVAFTTNTQQPVDGQSNEVPQTDDAMLDISKYYFYVGEARQTNFDVPTPVAYGYGDETAPPVSNDMFVDVEIMVNAPGKTTKLTKRIKFCKQSLAKEALCKDEMLNSTATYVESKQHLEVKSSTQRMLELAGINHPKNYVL